MGDHVHGGAPENGETAQSRSHRWSIGAAMVFKQSEYRGMDYDFIAFPAIGYRGERFSLQGVRGVLHFPRISGFTIDMFIQPRFSRFRDSDSPYLQGMQRRKMTAEAGLQIQTRLPGMLITSADISFDTLRVHKGHSASFTIARPVPLGRQVLTPFAGVEYLDDKFADYYYGVHGSEVREDRPAYQPNGLLNLSIGCRAHKRIGERLGLLGSISGTRIGGEAYRSPIVSSRIGATTFAALTIAL